MKIQQKDILYEDNHLIAVNKPASILVQSDHTNDKPLVEMVRFLDGWAMGRLWYSCSFVLVQSQVVEQLDSWTPGRWNGWTVDWLDGWAVGWL